MALASGSDRHNFDLKTRNHQDLFQLFTHTVLSSSDPEVTHGKPAPDCFLVAAARFSQPPKPENVSKFDGQGLGFFYFTIIIPVVLLCGSRQCSLEEFRIHASVLCGNRWCSLEQEFKIHWSVLGGSDAVFCKSSEFMLVHYVEVMQSWRVQNSC